MLAHPRLHKDEKCLSHDLETTTAVFDIPLSHDGDGNLSGSAHLTGEHLSRFLGQANADTNLVDSIKFGQASTNVGCAIGGNISYGSVDAGTHSPIQTADRVTHICGQSGALKAYHMVVPAGCESGRVTTYDLNTTTAFANVKTPQTRTNTVDAASRQLRWAPGTEANIAGTCTKVSANNETRYLVPHEVTGCGMSKLLKQNETSQGFCGDAYSPANRTATLNEKGEMCTVMTEHHFTGLRDQLGKKLETKDLSKHGLTLSFQSVGDNARIDNLLAMGGTPRVTCSAQFSRVPTKVMLENKEESPSIVMNVEDYHKLLGESPGGGAHKLSPLVAAAATNEGFATKIMALKLAGNTERGPQVTNAPILVENANGSVLNATAPPVHP